MKVFTVIKISILDSFKRSNKSRFLGEVSGLDFFDCLTLVENRQIKLHRAP